MSKDKAVFNAYWGEILNNEEKEFLNHTMANYRVEYDVPFEELQALKDVCINELRLYRVQNECRQLERDLKHERLSLVEIEHILEKYKSQLTPRESLTDPVQDPMPEEISRDSIDMSTYTDRGLGRILK